MKIRRIEPEDYEKGLIELLGELTIIDKDKISRIDFNNFVRNSQYDVYHTIAVIEDLGKIIATATLLVERKLIHNLSNVGHIEDVVVKKEYRGKDIGKTIIDHLVEEAKKMNCYKIILDCAEKNIGFYEKCGFKKHGIEMSYYLK